MASYFVTNEEFYLNGPAGGAKGLIPRDFAKHPQGYMRSAPPFPRDKIIPESQWDALFNEYKAKNANFANIRDHGNAGSKIPVKDQNGHGYCWAYSVGRAIELSRARDFQPYVELSAHAVAAIIKKGRDEGGWCTLSCDFAVDVGYPAATLWKKHSRDISQDTPELRASCALHKVVEFWDFPEDRDQARACAVSMFLMGFCGAFDFNHWSHSVCCHTLRNIKPLQIELDNSWTPNWGDDGSGILEGEKAIPNGAVAICVTVASTT